MPVHPRNILLLAAALAAMTAAVLLADGAMGAGSPTSLRSSSFSSASGTMSSGSYGIITELGSVGFVGRAASSNYTIQIGTGSTHTRARPGFLNHLPVVYSQTLSTTAGTPLTITLIGSDADGDTLGWAILLPVNGGLTDYVGSRSRTTNTIDVVFTPAAGFIGTASFRFYATDASAAGNTATVSINVTLAATPTPAPASVADATPTPPNVVNAPATSGWGLAALVASMLVVMVMVLRRTSGVRRAARP